MTEKAKKWADYVLASFDSIDQIRDTARLGLSDEDHARIKDTVHAETGITDDFTLNCIAYEVGDIVQRACAARKGEKDEA